MPPWTVGASSILNTARSGFVSAGRTVRDHLDRIWHVDPVRVQG